MSPEKLLKKENFISFVRAILEKETFIPPVKTLSKKKTSILFVTFWTIKML